jgi:hypothetical protein
MFSCLGGNKKVKPDIKVTVWENKKIIKVVRISDNQKIDEKRV